MPYFSGRIYGRGVRQRKWGQDHVTTCSRKVQNAIWRRHDRHERGGLKCPPLSRHGFIERKRPLLLSIRCKRDEIEPFMEWVVEAVLPRKV